MHKQHDPTHNKVPCLTMKYCDACRQIYKIGRNKHICRHPKCEHCGEPVLESKNAHECFIQPLKKPDLTTKYIFYDFETRYHNGKHEANFVCAMDMDGDTFCFTEGKCVEAFVKRYRKPKYKDYVYIAHNASGFDSYLLLEYFVRGKQNRESHPWLSWNRGKL